MPKTALVLSGGGAKGAFQMMAEKYARTEKGYRWDLISGVSVGALNGMLLSMNKFERLENIWNTISAEKVYTGKLNLWAILRLLFGARSIYGHEPLRALIQAEIDLQAFKTPLQVGTVSLRSGKYVPFSPQDPGFADAVLASTAIPIIWPPVDITPDHTDMVDGGVRNYSPLGSVLDADPDEVVVINCSPRDPPVTDKTFRNALDIGMHALEIALNEIFVTDLREFLRINRNVMEAAAAGITLHNENGKAYKYYACKIIEPETSLGGTLDFSRLTMIRAMQAGWERARFVLENESVSPKTAAV